MDSARKVVHGAELEPPPGKRVVALDVLRGLAILLVLFAHFDGPSGGAGGLTRWLHYLRYLGPSGVDLFFVLSGFLVGGLLFDELRRDGRIEVRRFLIRRVFKIWPSYFVFLGFIGVWLLVKEHRSVVECLRALYPNLIHLQNYLGSAREHTWSLAVEEHFYLALPLLLYWLSVTRRAALRTLPVIVLAVLCLCALLRLHAYGSRLSYNPHFATHLRADSLFFGVLLAYYHRFAPQYLSFARRHAGLLGACSIGVLFAVPGVILVGRRAPVLGALVFVLFYLAYGGLLLVLLQATPGQGFWGKRLAGGPARALASLGIFSYPVYLWHLDAGRLAMKILKCALLSGIPPELAWWVGFALYVLTASLAGVVFGIAVERPSLALRERLFPVRRQ